MSADISKMRSDIQKIRKKWQIIRDFKEGEDKVKEKGKTYLPAINSEMKNNDAYYKAYMERGEVKPATSKSIEANVGMILSKEPMIPDFPASVQHIKDDITKTGIDLEEFIAELTDEICTTQFLGVLVDYSEAPTDQKLTVAQKEALKLRSSASMYYAESIINFDIDDNGKLRVIVLEEVYNTYDEDDKDKLHPSPEKQYRQLIMRDGVYYNEIYRESGKNGFELYKQVIPVKNGQPLNFIPFLFMNGKDNTPSLCNPRMLAIATLNKHDYQDHTDYKWLLHNCAAPTAWVTGANKNDDLSRVGPGVVWKLTNDDAKVGVLETAGNAFPAMENNLKSNVEQMASLTLDSMNLTQGNETATRERYERTGKTVSLKQIARSIETGINKIIEWMFEWENVTYTDDYKIQFHTDYVEVTLDAQELQALVSAYIQGAISLQDLFYNLQRGGKVRPDKGFEEHQDEIEAQGGQVDEPLSMEED